MAKKNDKVDYKGLSEQLQKDVDVLSMKIVTLQKSLENKEKMLTMLDLNWMMTMHHLKKCGVYTGKITDEDVHYCDTLAKRILNYHQEQETKQR